MDDLYQKDICDELEDYRDAYRFISKNYPGSKAEFKLKLFISSIEKAIALKSELEFVLHDLYQWTLKPDAESRDELNVSVGLMGV